VDFPQPEVPASTTISPWPTVISNSDTAFLGASGYLKFSLLISRISANYYRRVVALPASVGSKRLRQRDRLRAKTGRYLDTIALATEYASGTVYKVKVKLKNPIRTSVAGTVLGGRLNPSG